MKPLLLPSSLLAALALPLLAGAEEPDLGGLSCPTLHADSKIELYTRNHEVPVVAEPEPLADVSDSLRVKGRNEKILCFGLVTVGRNYHQCGFMGIAHAVSPAVFLYQDGPTKLRITLLGDDAIHVEAVGDGYKANCGFHGVIEAGIYRREGHAS